MGGFESSAYAGQALCPGRSGDGECGHECLAASYPEHYAVNGEKYIQFHSYFTVLIETNAGE